jgi:hypothetical protein
MFYYRTVYIIRKSANAPFHYKETGKWNIGRNKLGYNNTRRRRRSTTGLIACYNQGPLMISLSTEAKYFAASAMAIMVRYLRFLRDLDTQEGGQILLVKRPSHV